MLELKWKKENGKNGKREGRGKRNEHALEIPANEMARLHFTVVRVTLRQFAVRGMPLRNDRN